MRIVVVVMGAGALSSGRRVPVPTALLVAVEATVEVVARESEVGISCGALEQATTREVVTMAKTAGTIRFIPNRDRASGTAPS